MTTPTTPESEPTPRTDAKAEEIRNGECLPGCNRYFHEELCPYCNDVTVALVFARQLERELNQANAEIARYTRMSESGETLGDALDLRAELSAARDEIIEISKALGKEKTESERWRVAYQNLHAQLGSN